MSNNEIQKAQSPVVAMFKRPEVTEKFKEILGAKGTAFTASVLALATSNTNFANCNPTSVYTAAMTAATLDLPIQPNLGFAYVIPYGSAAQFQVGWKGLVQLAQRSGQYKTIAVEPIYQGQIVSENPLTGYVFDFAVRPSGSPIGYAAFFELHNGFTKTLYWGIDRVKAHRAKFSKAKNSPWDSDFDAMACKTVLKQLLKWGPLSVEMQKAMSFDGGVITETDHGFTPEFDTADDITPVDERAALYEEMEANKYKFSPEEFDKLMSILDDNATDSFPKVRKALDEVKGGGK